MTAKDFELIARTLNQVEVDEGDGDFTRGYACAVHDLAHDFASELAKTNPRFDRERFLKACGV